jgi:hypothetical protein
MYQTYATNKKIACTPFPSQVVEKEVKHGFVAVKQRGTLTKLKVIFWHFDIAPGSEVYVRSEQFAAAWAKEVFEIDGVPFILVPEDQIVLIGNAPGSVGSF